MRIHVGTRMAEISNALLSLNEKVETSIQKQSQFEQRVSDRFNEVQVLMENQTVRVNGANRVAHNLHFDQQQQQQVSTQQQQLQEQLQQQQFQHQQIMQQQLQQNPQYPQMQLFSDAMATSALDSTRDGAHTVPSTHPRRHHKSSSMRGIHHI